MMESGSLTEALRETLAIFDGSGEPRTTPEVAEHLDLGRRSTYARLKRLVEQNRLETKKVGANGRVWWRPPTNADTRSQGWPAAGEFPADDRKEQQFVRQQDRSRSELDEVINRISDGFFAVNDEWEFTYLNDTTAEILDSPKEAFLGEELWEVLSDLTGTEFETAYREAMTNQEPSSVESYYPPLDSWYRDIIYPSASGLSIYFIDVTERKQREQKLQKYERIVETVGDGIYVLDSDSRFTTVNSTFTTMTGYDRDDLIGAHAELVFGDEFVDLANEKQASFEAENRDIAVLEEDLYRADGTSVVVESRFSLFELETGETGRVGVVRDVTDRVEYERELEYQREQLAALTNLNEVINTITQTVIGQPTREDIEATVCEHLADTDSYLFAWIGDIDATTQTVNLRTEAGVEGYLEEITISVDPDDDRSDGPTGRAFRTEEMQTSQNTLKDPEYEPWREAAREHGFRSSAAVPISHEGAVYGVLNVYAKRPDAFEGHEGRLIAQIGEIIGHAVAATERKQTLVSDTLVELEFQIRDVFTTFDVSSEAEGIIIFDQIVPISNDRFLVYGTATPDAIDTVTDLSETLPHGEKVTIHSEEAPSSFELQLTDPPILSAIASLNGYVDNAVIENGDYQMTIHLAPSVDVRRVVDAVEAAYPQAELLRHRQITRSQDNHHCIQHPLPADLTDRQRATLAAAYQMGFFEWPREKTGEEVAESLDVAPATFHHHLRKGELKVFSSLFSTTDKMSDNW